MKTLMLFSTPLVQLLSIVIETEILSVTFVSSRSGSYKKFNIGTSENLTQD